MLSGSLRVSGAKNAALPAMAAALLTDEDCVIEDVPHIGDIAIMGNVLRSLGATVEEVGEKRLKINARDIRSFTAPTELVVQNRASFLVMGPLLARFGEAASSPPGGDVIGQRPIDVHLVGFATLGAEISWDGGKYAARARRLHGAKIFMDYPSHIGTENLLLAASLAKGTTILRNASGEPEVVCLAEMLNKMGARISGAGTSTIEIQGVDRLGGTTHRVIPDRIEAGTFAIAAALCGEEVQLHGVVPDHLDSLLWKLKEVGVPVSCEGDRLTVRRGDCLSATHVQALPYPGFATDLQAAMGVLLTQCQGGSIVHERVYDNRLQYANELRKMGGQVEVEGLIARITGPTPLKGAPVRALDIRSGAALILAGLVAQGVTEVHDIYHLDRGYESFEERLTGLGARIQRVVPEGVVSPVPGA
ncbi:MAG: UDP-N-acetylglucosamine 1-carboxyvinyltransferase [Chloroflexi bacterium]|nr:UDP-N-acetylglucosamine 1-carboxyvinyltransferase [Chloroflexota bacterium]